MAETTYYRSVQITNIETTTYCLFIVEQITADLEEILSMLLEPSNKLFLN